jgi:DNA-binding PadR family transcriptional regulator
MQERKKEAVIPRLSHLQFAVLEILGTATKRGKDLRKSLSELGIKKSGPAFYQMMARLEEAKFARGWYEQQIIDGQIIKERHYQITGNGIDALNETKKFYVRSQQMAAMPAFA